MLPVGRQFLFTKDPRRLPKRFVITHSPTTTPQDSLKSTDVYWARSLDANYRAPFLWDKETGQMKSALKHLRCFSRFRPRMLGSRGWKRGIALDLLVSRHEFYSSMDSVLTRLRSFEGMDDEYKRGALSMFCSMVSTVKGTGGGTERKSERRLVHLLQDPPPFLLQGRLQEWRRRLFSTEEAPGWVLRMREHGWDSEVYTWNPILSYHRIIPDVKRGFFLGVADVIRLVTSLEYFRAE